jgi:hypothetical protein
MPSLPNAHMQASLDYRPLALAGHASPGLGYSLPDLCSQLSASPLGFWAKGLDYVVVRSSIGADGPLDRVS